MKFICEDCDLDTDDADEFVAHMEKEHPGVLTEESLEKSIDKHVKQHTN